MSMPQPIFVALIGSSKTEVEKARKYFRLSTPGIGAPYLSALDAPNWTGIIPRLFEIFRDGGNKIANPANLPKGRITLWLALDPDALLVAQRLHAADRRMPRYERGFYEDLLPEPCVLVCDSDKGKVSLVQSLANWEKRIVAAWEESS